MWKMLSLNHRNTFVYTNMATATCHDYTHCKWSTLYTSWIDPLHSDVTIRHFRICLFGRRYVGGQKCITVIERKALIASLLTNASDYSSKTTIFVRYNFQCKSYWSSHLRWWTTIRLVPFSQSPQYISDWLPTWRRPNGHIQKWPKCDVTCNGLCLGQVTLMLLIIASTYFSDFKNRWFSVY